MVYVHRAGRLDWSILLLVDDVSGGGFLHHRYILPILPRDFADAATEAVERDERDATNGNRGKQRGWWLGILPASSNTPPPTTTSTTKLKVCG